MNLAFLLNETPQFLKPMPEEFGKEAFCNELLHCCSAEALKASLTEVPSSTFCIPRTVYSGCLRTVSWMSMSFK